MVRKRTLRAEEEKLWRRLTENVRPLAPERMKRPRAQQAEAGEPETRSRQNPGESHGETAGAAPGLGAAPARKAAAQRPVVGKARRETPPATRPQPLLEAGDPRQARRVSRGRRPIEATLDLHGLTQEQAFTALRRFLGQARAIGYQTVLVITGKGAPEGRGHSHADHDMPRGILRRRFVDWVEGPLREHVASVRQSHQRHGGAGAFYVFLKKPGS